MAEIQWVIEVRCVNTLLAEFKVGERGQHVCVHVPDRDLDPHEFGKMIAGAEEASRIARAHRAAQPGPAAPEGAEDVEARLGTVRQVGERHDLYDIQVLQTGEIVSVDTPGAIMGPSEREQFIVELKAVQRRLAAL